MSTVPLKHFCLVDGSGFLFRAYHAIQPMSRPDGTPVNAVFGFSRMLMKLMQESKADHLAVIFDAGRETFRNQIYPEYKAHRPEPEEDMIPQFALVREATRAFGVPAIEVPGFEADDLIATYAKIALEHGARVTIVSSDKDLMQLVRPGVEMYDPLKERPIGPAQVFEKFGVTPDKVVDVQALAGDSTDNVPGVPGIGVKTAAQLITEYGDLDTLLARAGEIKQPKRRELLLANADAARMSRELVRLKDDVPVPATLDSFVRREPDRATLFAFLDAQNFRSIRAHFADGKAVGQGAPATVPSPIQPTALSAPTPELPGTVAPVVPDGPARYELVLTEEALEAWIAEAMAAGMLAVDTETDSLDPMRANLVGVSLAVTPGRACYIPVRHDPVPNQGALDLGGGTAKETRRILPAATTLKMLKPLLEDPSILKIGHNIKFDMKVLAQNDIEVGPVDDTLVLSFVLEGSSHGHGMDELAQLHLGHNTIKYEDVCGSGKNQITFDRVPLDKATDYAAEDAEVTLRLHRLFKPRLLAERMVAVYETFDRPLIPVLSAMERAGIRVDRGELEAMSVEFGRRMVELEAEAQKLAGQEFNVGSPKQLGEILFDRLGLPGGKKSAKTGAYATGADVLEELSPLHELPRKVLDWRQISKLKSTYADALVTEINPATGRVHTNYGLAGASTGRLSSSDPNLQNIPIRTDEGRRIRKAFIAEKGHMLLSADYSQIELRLVAHVANIEGLKRAFEDGADIHAITASQVFGIPVEGMDPMVRRRAKAINFGIIYGISAFGLANQLGIEQREAKAYIDAYFGRYPEIRTYMENVKDEARKHGFVLTPFGRKCFTPGIKDKNPAMRAFSERAAINAPIQGGAADIIKRAMVRLPPALTRAGLAARMLLQVHDELVFEVPEAEVAATTALVKQVMEGAARLAVPLVVDTGAAKSWAEAH